MLIYLMNRHAKNDINMSRPLHVAFARTFSFLNFCLSEKSKHTQSMFNALPELYSIRF